MNKPGVTRVLLARRLRILRAARGWSQEVLGELAGLTRGYISAVERVEYDVSLDNIEKIARAFGMTVEELLAREWDGIQL